MRQATLRRFLFYGVVGWSLEVVFTGALAAIHDRDRSATAKTYLWMHPIYGAAGLLMEALYGKLRRHHPLVRAAAGLGIIYPIEFVSGWLLRRALGRCPWDYGKNGLNVAGLVRLDYAPAWLAAGLLFEAVEPVAKALMPPAAEQR